MKYLYGDGTASPLALNYIELLRDGLDFAVTMLMAADVVTKYRRTADDRERQTAGELGQLRSLSTRLDDALSGMTGLETAPTAERTVAAIRTAGQREIQVAEHEVQETLNIEREQVNRAIAKERARNHQRLEALLLRHDLPGSAQWVNVWLDPDGKYVATLEGRSTTEVSWVIDLDIPSDHLFGELLRLDRLRPQLTIKVPEEAGWVRKRVKLTTYKLSNKYLVAITRRGDNGKVRLRTAPQGSEVGLDAVFGGQGQLISVARLAKGGPPLTFEAEREDRELLEGLWRELSRAAHQLRGRRRSLREARLDDTPLEEHTNPVRLVKRLVAEMAPVVQEIGARSLSPEELVLKRVLGDDRREEIFASKADLLSKLAPLSPRMQRLFDPLGLGEPPQSSSGPAPSRPAPSRPAPSRPAPSRPAPSRPAPSRPAPSRPAPPHPAPSQPVPSQTERDEDLEDTARRPAGRPQTPPPPRSPSERATRQIAPTTNDSVEVTLDELD